MPPLRQRLLEEMQMRNLSPRTQDVYVRAMVKFSQHHRKSPHQLGKKEIRAYLVALVRLKTVLTQWMLGLTTI